MAILDISKFADHTANQLKEELERAKRRIVKVERENRKLKAQLATEQARRAVNPSMPLKVQIATLAELGVWTKGIQEITGATAGYIKNIKSQLGVKNERIPKR